jgi:hypothetical protein
LSQGIREGVDLDTSVTQLHELMGIPQSGQEPEAEPGDELNPSPQDEPPTEVETAFDMPEPRSDMPDTTQPQEP